MATKTWVGGAGSWDNAADWSPGGVPTFSDNAVIGAGANVAFPSSFVQASSVSLGGPTAVLELSAAGSAILTGGGTPGDSLVDGGIVFLASPDEARPAELSGFYLTLGMNLTVNVTGAGYLGGGGSPFEPDQVTLAPGATYQASLSDTNDILVTTTAQPAATVAFADQTTGASGSHAMDAAAGGPDYLQWQYLDAGSDTVAMTAGLPNVFLKGGAGTKALAAGSGRNVLDGGTGSAILTGGTGNDTFFLDVRGTAQVWDTLVNFGAGDALTVWGWSPGSGTETLDALDGAAGRPSPRGHAAPRQRPGRSGEQRDPRWAVGRSGGALADEHGHRGRVALPAYQRPRRLRPRPRRHGRTAGVSTAKPFDRQPR